jgi:hypothetical protein
MQKRQSAGMTVGIGADTVWRQHEILSDYWRISIYCRRKIAKKSSDWQADGDIQAVSISQANGPTLAFS